MSWAEIEVLFPLTIVGATAVAIMLTISFWRNQTAAAIMTVTGLLVALGCVFWSWSLAPRDVDTLLLIDHFGLVFVILTFGAGIAVTMMAHSALAVQRIERSEFYILLLLATDGAAILATSTHFISFFLGLELLSVSLYVMIAYIFTRDTAIEAGLKYLFLAAISSAFLLFGMALLYAEFGTMTFRGVATGIVEMNGTGEPLVLAGLVLLFVGVGFKLSLVPFHMWTPDIYEGAPASVAGYLATVSKGAVAAVLLRFAYELDLQSSGAVARVVAWVAIFSMFAGNLLALRQESLRRILAFSSIAHMGYLLVAFLAGGTLAIETVTFYIVTYFITSLGAFGVLGLLADGRHDHDRLEDFRGLFWRRPWVSLVLTAMLFSLAGLPLTAGFVGKFVLMLAGVEGELWSLVIIMIANSAIGLYYYLRVVMTMYAPSAAPAAEYRARREDYPVSVVLGVLLLLLLLLGLAPQPFLHVIENATASLGG